MVGILALVVISQLSRIGGQTRDLERRLDINLIATRLEKYYEDNNHYPGSSDSNQIAQNLGLYDPGLIDTSLEQQIGNDDAPAVIDPSGQLLEAAPTDSEAKPDSGYGNRPPDGPQYSYIAYGCLDSDQEESAAEEESDSETDDSEETSAAINYGRCSSFVLYAWLERPDPGFDHVYAKDSLQNEPFEETETTEEETASPEE